MSSRKIMQAPGLPSGPRSNRQPQIRGFWEWLFGNGIGGRG
jgi:hypothetical protein